MTQSLAQLQAEWETPPRYPADPSYEAGARDARWKCASALQPHVEREAAAQAKSLVDERRIADLAHHLEVMCGCVREGHAHELRLARECLAALRVGDAK